MASMRKCLCMPVGFQRIMDLNRLVSWSSVHESLRRSSVVVWEGWESLPGEEAAVVEMGVLGCASASGVVEVEVEMRAFFLGGIVGSGGRTCN